jgi:molybdate transport system permease protein
VSWLRFSRPVDSILSPAADGRERFLSLCIAVSALFALLVLLLVAADAWYLVTHGMRAAEAWHILARPVIRRAIVMSLTTSLCSLLLTVAFSLPMGYVLSRCRFPGRALLDTLVDVPIVVPPVVIGVSLLAFFGTGAGMALKRGLTGLHLSLVSGLGIVLCQFLVSAPYCIRAAKAAFDEVDRELEAVAMVLGGDRWRTFRGVTLPLARNGLVAGGVMAWARAIGVFGPIMAFIGTGPRVQVMPTCIWLELSVGNIEVSLTLALLMLGLSGTALLAVHVLAPGRSWT